MGQLLFKKCFWDAIRGGTKRTTIRRWTSPRVKPGQRAWTPGVGWLAIESVERLDDLDHLTDADAVADGFTSASEMLATLESLYPQHPRDGRSWFRVKFRIDGVEGSKSSSKTKTKTKTASPSRRKSRSSNGKLAAPLATSRQSSRRASRLTRAARATRATS